MPKRHDTDVLGSTLTTAFPMTSSTVAEDTEIEDVTGTELTREIALIQSQILSLKAQRSLYASSIFSAQRDLSLFNHLDASNESSATNKNLTPIHSHAKEQHLHNQANLYRLCAGITAFRTFDSDPKAADGGHLFGLRFDVSKRGKFIRPYYVILNKQNSLLKIYKHTLPPAIPITHLANKYLPQEKDVIFTEVRTNEKSSRHPLHQFSRALRNFIVSYHNRLVALQDIRAELRLKQGKETEIIDVSATDAEAKQIILEWVNGRTGRVTVDEDGQVKKCVTIKNGRRDRTTETMFISREMRGICEFI